MELCRAASPAVLQSSTIARTRAALPSRLPPAGAALRPWHMGPLSHASFAEAALATRPGPTGTRARASTELVTGVEDRAAGARAGVGGEPEVRATALVGHEWRVQEMKQVLELEKELHATFQRVEATRARCERLRDQLDRMEEAAMRSKAKVRGDQAKESEDEKVEREKAQVVLLALEQSERRLGVLNKLVAGLSQAMSLKEDRIVRSLVLEKHQQRRLQEIVHGGAAKVDLTIQRLGPDGALAEHSMGTVPEQEEGDSGHEGSRGLSSEKGMDVEQMDLGRAGLQKAAAEAGKEVQAEDEKRQQRQRERRKMVLALYAREVAELLEEVYRKVELLHLQVEHAGEQHDGDGAQPDWNQHAVQEAVHERRMFEERLDAAVAIGMRLEELLKSIRERLLQL